MFLLRTPHSYNYRNITSDSALARNAAPGSGYGKMSHFYSLFYFCCHLHGNDQCKILLQTTGMKYQQYYCCLMNLNSAETLDACFNSSD